MGIMAQKNEAVLRARKELIQQTFEKICKKKEFSELRIHTRVVLMHLWLHIKAEEEGLLTLPEWDNPENREDILKRVKGFLVTHIK